MLQFVAEHEQHDGVDLRGVPTNLLELFPESTVADGSGHAAFDVDIALGAATGQDDVQWLTRVYLDATGVISELDMTVTVAGESAELNMRVTGIGDLVTAPPGMYDRLPSSLLSEAIDYASVNDDLQGRLQAAARTAVKLARIDERPAARRDVFVTLSLSDITDGPLYRVKPDVPRGYKVVAKHSPHADLFPAICFTLQLRGSARVQVRSC